MQTEIKIKGMTCGHCESRVTAELLKIAAVENVTASAEKGHAVIDSASELNMQELQNAVIAAGYSLIN